MSTGKDDQTWVDGLGDETSVDGGADATTVDGGAASGDSYSLISLPASLRSRYTLVRELERGSQGVPLVVRDSESGEYRLIKIHDHAPGEEYEQILTTVMTGEVGHLVRIHDFGAEGRYFWEIQEYCEGGSLADLIASGRLTTDRRMFDGVVAEVSGAISHLQSLGKPGSRERWVHRDIKPANVLIRALEPLDLVLCDFGLTKVIEGSQAKASASATALYAAPEVFGADITSPARDWWALGMMVIEMTTGKHPFVADNGVAFSPYEIQKYVITKRIDTSEIQDSRIRSLAQGLLVRDPQNRWNGEQVEAWLRGEDPSIDDIEAPPMPIESNRGPVRTATPFDFTDPGTGEDMPYTSPTELAKAMAVDWDRASEVIFGGREMRVKQRSLREFVESAGLSDDIEERAIAQFSGDPGEVHRRLFIFLRCLDSSLPPTYRGVSLDQESLAGLASRAVSGDEKSRDITASLFEDQPIRILSGEGSAEDLFAMERQWNRLAEEAEDSIRELADAMRGSGEVPAHDELRRSAICLALLLTANEGSRAELVGSLREMREGDAGQVEAWATIADRALSGSQA